MIKWILSAPSPDIDQNSIKNKKNLIHNGKFENFPPHPIFFFGGGGQLDKKGVGVAFRRAIVILISIFLTYVTNKIMTVLIWAFFFNLNVSQNPVYV